MARPWSPVELSKQEADIMTPEEQWKQDTEENDKEWREIYKPIWERIKDLIPEKEEKKMETRTGRFKTTEHFLILQATEGTGITSQTVNYTSLYGVYGEASHMGHLADFPTWEEAEAELERMEKQCTYK